MLHCLISAKYIISDVFIFVKLSRMPREDTLFGLPLKYLSLVLLTAQVCLMLGYRSAISISFFSRSGDFSFTSSFSPLVTGHTLGSNVHRTADMLC